MSDPLTRPVRRPSAKAPREAAARFAQGAIIEAKGTAMPAATAPAVAEPIAFEAGSGNVFADLNLPDAADEAIKARLVMRLRAEMDRRGLNQTEFAKVLGVKQPDVSNLLRGRVLGFTLDRMLGLVQGLGDDVEITLRPSKAERRGRMSLKVA